MSSVFAGTDPNPKFALNVAHTVSNAARRLPIGQDEVGIE
jgi:hypothetical protein